MSTNYPILLGKKAAKRPFFMKGLQKSAKFAMLRKVA